MVCLHYILYGLPAGIFIDLETELSTVEALKLLVFYD
jgi:hypothetical protein